MGNQLASLTPPPLVNVEDCLSDSTNVRFEEELFGSRLFKVAKVKRVDDNSSRLLVVKLFPHPNASQLLSLYKGMLHSYCRQILNGYNLLAFSVTPSPTDRNVVLTRDFIDQSLNDRLCTRPFLCTEEKRWIAFQILRAVAQLHRTTTVVEQNESGASDADQRVAASTRPLCHGDIKAENVLLTSWGWVLLADPAPFKPCWLPADNPSEFTQYFDSSRRRVCYLAPERFVDVKSSPNVVRSPQEHSSLVMLPIGNSIYLDKESSTETGDCIASIESETDLKGAPQVSKTTVGTTETDSTKQDPPVSLSPDTGESNSVQTGSGVENASVVASEITEGRVATKQTLASDTGDQNPPQSRSVPVARSLHLTLPSQTNQSLPESLLSPPMDLFSVGCVLLELFTDGSVAFTLADLLNYRANDRCRVLNLLKQVPCPQMRSLISGLLSLDPVERGTAEGRLMEQRGAAFPAVFYSHLTQYMQKFLHTSLRNPTLRIAYLRRTLSGLLQSISPLGPSSLSTAATLLCNLVTSVLRPLTAGYVTQTPSIAAALSPDNKSEPITVHEPFSSNRPSASTAAGDSSELNGMRLLESGKVDALICLLQLSQYLSPTQLLDRIIPYCVDLTSAAHSGEVRGLALEALTQILRLATDNVANLSQIPASFEVLFLTEYLFPTLAPLSGDPQLRRTYARCLPDLAECASRFLCSASATGHLSMKASREEEVVNKPVIPSAPVNPESGMDAYDAYLMLLRTHIQDRFSDLDRQVRHALMNTDSLAKLAKFFGRSHTNGTLLSHMITFLNDKDDPGLRSSFYRQVAPLASLVGAQSIGVIRPLLEQGLIDQDEIVIETCLQSLTHLLRRRLLGAPVAVVFLTRALALTSHPTRRLRQSAVAYVTAFARHAVHSTGSALPKEGDNGSTKDPGSTCVLGMNSWSGFCSPASVYARLANAEVSRTFFRRSVHQCFTSDSVLLANLYPPVSRGVLESLITMVSTANHEPSVHIKPQHLLDQFLRFLQERKASRAVTRSGETPCYASPSDEAVALLFGKLRSLGLTERMEAQLLSLAPLLKNLCETYNDRLQKSVALRTCSNQPRALPKFKTLVVDTNQTNFVFTPTKMETVDPSDGGVGQTDTASYLRYLNRCLQPPARSCEQLIRRAYFSGRLPINLDRTSIIPRPQSFGRGLVWRQTPFAPNSGNDAAESVGENAAVGNSVKSGCGVNTLVQTDVMAKVPDRPLGIPDLRVGGTNQPECPLWPEGRPQGNLIAHLQEHHAGMLSLAVHASGRLMASCSSGDGTVKLWNCGLWPVNSDGYLSQSAYFVHPAAGSGSESIGRSSGLSKAGLAQIYSLPTHSSWTYSTKTEDTADDTSHTCRGLVWTTGGSSLVTVASGKWLHRIDVATGRRCGLNSLSMAEHGRAVCMTASASSQFPAQLNLLHSRLGGGGDANLIAYATTSNHIVARDLRIPFSSQPVWCLKQDGASGLVRSMAMHSCHTWLVTGTSRGHLVSWDLRYERPVAWTEHPGCQAPVSLLNLQLVETQSTRTLDSLVKPSRLTNDETQNKNAQNSSEQTLIVGATDYHNGITIWDLEACASASSAAVSATTYGINKHNSPAVSDGRIVSAWSRSADYSVARAVLCIPGPANPVSDPECDPAYSQLPTVITGGNDGRLRCWNFAKPSTSKVFAWAGEEEASPPTIAYKWENKSGVRTVFEETLDQQEGNSEVNAKRPGLLVATSNSNSFGIPQKQMTTAEEASTTRTGSFPAGGRLELREPSRGHKNIVSDMTLIRAGQYFLASASMDGVIKIWR